jgi:hypothetical protein
MPILTTELGLTLAQFALKFGLQAAIELAKAIKSGADIDTAISCLENAEKKSAQQYLDEDKALNPVIVPDPPDQAP